MTLADPNYHKTLELQRESERRQKTASTTTPQAEKPPVKTKFFDEKKFRASIPSEMLAAKRWMRFFVKNKPDGKGTAKIPLGGSGGEGNHADSSTWSTFDEAVAAIENDQQGLGYAFFEGEIQGLDIDHCRNAKTGQICNEAMMLLSRLPSWAEYSVSGQGIHVLFKGNVRGKQLGEQCLQFWNSKNSPRFFALTCDLVGDAFTNLKDVGEDFNYIFATARHISAKIREELKTVDLEQWASLPAEREPVETVTREKSKTKTRKVHKEFNIKDFLAFYGLGIDNETDNELGHCIRLTTCPLKGEPHVGHNGTTCNFIYPCKDGGLAYHCQSTGCVEYGIGDVVNKLAADHGVYPKKIYEAKQESGLVYSYSLQSLNEVEETSLSWLWNGFLPDNQLVHFQGASSEGKSPVTTDIIARVTTGAAWPDGTPNTLGPRSVILLAGEDNLSDKVIPRLRLAGADISKVKIFKVTAKREAAETELNTAIDRDYQGLVNMANTLDDLALIVIDPITNYLGKQSMNKEEDIRSNIAMPLATFAQEKHVCIVTVGHLNKRDKDATALQRGMGAAAFTGVPRLVFIFGNDPEEENTYAHVMKEVRDKQVAIQYKTTAVPDPKGIQKSPIIKIEWGKLVEADADEVVNAPSQKDKSVTAKATMLVLGMLKSGSKKKAELDQALKENGIDPDKIEWTRLKKRCKAESKPLPGKGAGWSWFLVAPEQAEFDGAQRKPPQHEERITA
ncbi:MAG: AAA family ATPase [Candidatus Sulfotelmatobacter sp.]